VDALFSAVRPPAVPRVPAKGHSAPTLALVQQALRAAHRDLSAAEAAELTGVSRATPSVICRTSSEGTVRPVLRYGATGRPEHRYKIAS
jgi:response regulator of citrate/malate metabolism